MELLAFLLSQRNLMLAFECTGFCFDNVAALLVYNCRAIGYIYVHETST